MEPKIKAEILIVEDNKEDEELTLEILKNTTMDYHASVVRDGVEALEFLRKEGIFKNAPSPHLVLLDLNLPRKDGRELLVEMKTDRHFKTIPVIILTTSHDEKDIIKSYDHHANCYMTKPGNLDELLKISASIDSWLTTVKLPQ